jgi:hypothetical protein
MSMMKRNAPKPPDTISDGSAADINGDGGDGGCFSSKNTALSNHGDDGNGDDHRSTVIELPLALATSSSSSVASGSATPRASHGTDKRLVTIFCAFVVASIWFGSMFDFGLALAVTYAAFLLLHTDNRLAIRVCHKVFATTSEPSSIVMQARCWMFVLLVMWSVFHAALYYEHWFEFDLRKIVSGAYGSALLVALSVTTIEQYQLHWISHVLCAVVSVLLSLHRYVPHVHHTHCRE